MNARSIVALLGMALLLAGCGGGGTPSNRGVQLTVGNITGPDSVVAGTSASYTVSASGESSLAYYWSLAPQAAGALTHGTTVTVTLVPAPVAFNTQITIEVTVMGVRARSVTRTKTITITTAPGGTAPKVHSITPSGGAPGGLVNFLANVDGTPPLTYRWDFGGGATPNIQGRDRPGATLGAEGSYSGTLRVTNAFGGDTLPFTLTVSPAPVAPSVLRVGMSGFYSGGLCTFTAYGGGAAPLSYSWDFGGGANPGSAANAKPAVTLLAAGAYNGSVTVTNAAGTDTLDFTYTVYPQQASLFALLDGRAVIKSPDGAYLGIISSDTALADSIMNSSGDYGGAISATSIFNPTGVYGADWSYLSPWDSAAGSPPMIFLGDVFAGWLTTSTAFLPAVNPYGLESYLQGG